MSQQRVLDDIIKERIRQDEKWGTLKERTTHDVMEWFVILMEEVGEASQEALRLRYSNDNDKLEAHDHLYEELVQCAAVCAAMLESMWEGLI